MKTTILVLALLAVPALDGCASGGTGFESNSFGNRVKRSEDTLGTQRRMDVYGGATAPVLPTMGAPGYGK